MRRLLGALLVAGSIASAPAAHAASSGCAEAWQAPHSTVADRCRDRGWTIHVGPLGHGITASPRGVVSYLWLKRCRFEDGGRLPCSWNLNHRDGGLSYWMSGSWAKHRVHYVWPSLPTYNGWQWVSSELADALAEGGAPDAATRDWQACVVKGEWSVKCPDGYREVS